MAIDFDAEKEKAYVLDIDSCLVCHQCLEVCPVDANHDGRWPFARRYCDPLKAENNPRKEIVMKKVSLLCLLVLVVFPVAVATFTQAAEFPNKPLQVIIPYGPGGTHDIAARIVDGQLQKVLSVPVVHVNKPGGGGMVGGVYALEQPADGYTILYGGLTVLIEVPIVTPNCPYTLQDFIPVARVTSGPLILAVGKESPYKNLEEFIAAAKKNPGKVTVGTPGIGTSQHLVVALFAKEAGLDLNIIPFKGDGAAITALLGNHVDSVIT